MSVRRVAPLLASLCGLGAAGWAFLLRPRLQRWGARPEEAERPMLLDGQLPGAQVVTNRAISIEAPPEAVWPWIVQMGEVPRGGFYSYMWVERLMGMQVLNAEEVIPEFQHLEAGDSLDRAGNMRVKAVDEAGHCLVLGPPPGLPFDSTWALAVYPDGDGHSRFVSRVRACYRRWTPANLLIFLVLEPGQWLMERKMLREVKKRAERPPLARPDPLAV